MPLLYSALFIAFLSPISSEHIESYYLEFLANHYSEYEKLNVHGILISPTKRVQSLVEDSEYYLYTRNNIDYPVVLNMNDYSSINSSYFDPSLQVVAIVHGWGGDLDSDLNSALKDAFLSKESVNVIVVDWGHLSKQDYISAVRDVPEVGKHLGRFLTDMNAKTGASFSQMHLVGHSLGAHVVGTAGRQLNGRVARITGLDPAGPLWSFNSNCLKSSDAVYVEAIHTNRGILGINSIVGDADFYPNGGFVQPGCITPTCSHARSWQLFAASLIYNHLFGRKCSVLLQAKFRACNGSPYPLGTDDLRKNQTGIYALNTTSTYPF